ncbi:uncharacterized protein BXZ73DRAFT_74267 [Epithele typhae]|uniref:uncharacterized protein n=1 Tax=Epithele typhae TaxID=378194 RepID=UPI00200858E8|nr:uncharacterized protein BXZ73DRAFT_74267 [Epithele typhae]KAH9943275.1 hypothetical protein BXZ73DRAFT_74267 [Epithele typhae]
MPNLPWRLLSPSSLPPDPWSKSLTHRRPQRTPTASAGISGLASAEKGLTDTEISVLLYELPQPAPAVPPRTYPRPPPSKVPYMLLNILRAFTWVAGGSAALLLAYFRFLYPRIAQTYQARVSLHVHRSALLDRMTKTLNDLKATQKTTFAVLPQPELLREPPQYAICSTLDELVEASAGSRDISAQSLLRCAIAECSKTGQNATSADLFRVLVTKLPWIPEEGANYEDSLWQTLTTTPAFLPTPSSTSMSTSSSPSPSPPTPSVPAAPTQDTIWTYNPSPSAPAPPLLASLSALSAALPAVPASPPPSKFGHTLDALVAFTGHLARQVYAPTLPFRTSLPAPTVPPALEDDLRREIRALKGLVLNRRSFMPRSPLPGSAVGIAATSGRGGGSASTGSTIVAPTPHYSAPPTTADPAS